MPKNYQKSEQDLSVYEEKAWSNHRLPARFVIAVYSVRERQAGFPLLSAHVMKVVLMEQNPLCEKLRKKHRHRCIYTPEIFRNN